MSWLGVVGDRAFHALEVGVRRLTAEYGTRVATQDGGAVTVATRFKALLSNLAITPQQRKDGGTKHEGVRRCLNKHYYGTTSSVENSRLIGSWAKATQIRPPRDIDVLFQLPYSVYERYEKRSGNKQSQLLQEVKGVLAATYSSTKMRGDGQVVLVPFISYTIELVPAFRLKGGRYWVCDTNGGGRYKTTDPDAEFQKLKSSNDASKGNTRHLVRMMKRWQSYCNVPLKSFDLELVAIEFVDGWKHRGESEVYYDWMVRDFLGHLAGKANGYVFVPGTGDLLALGDAWLSKATTAHGRAKKACEYESKEESESAGDEWQKLFGSFIPKG